MNSPQTCVMRRSILPALVFLCLTNQGVHAGSATWNLNPGNAGWDTPSNWAPATEPNGPGDIATFDVSNLTNLQMSSRVEVDRIVFNPGASAFTFTPFQSFTMPLILSGAGIQNNSDATQTFVASVLFLNEALISFTGSASAGSRTAFTAEGAEEMGAQGAFVTFSDNAAAGSGDFHAAGGSASGAYGGSILFDGLASAGSGTFTNDAGQTAGALGGGTAFSGSASAGLGQFTANGSVVSGGFGGHIVFLQTSTAAGATITALSGTNGGAGGAIVFDEEASGGDARAVITGNAQMDISAHNAPGVTVGSVEGDGAIFLGSENLTLNGTASTTFSGVISDGGAAGGRRGSLTRAGFGTLTLSGANTYSGRTTVENNAFLNVTNVRGSATGTGPLMVTSGRLAGTGKIAGPVTIGTPSSTDFPGQLWPGVFADHATLTMRKTLTLSAQAAYRCTLREATAVADKVVANGVTLQSGALFFLVVFDSAKLAPHTVFTVLDNTAATPISGRFVNLADGEVIRFGKNKFRTSYEGGDGNDLTLTVVIN